MVRYYIVQAETVRTAGCGPEYFFYHLVDATRKYDEIVGDHIEYKALTAYDDKLGTIVIRDYLKEDWKVDYGIMTREEYEAAKAAEPMAIE